MAYVETGSERGSASAASAEVLSKLGEITVPQRIFDDNPYMKKLRAVAAADKKNPPDQLNAAPAYDGQLCMD